jgi:hypothetical protein
VVERGYLGALIAREGGQPGVEVLKHGQSLSARRFDSCLLAAGQVER